MPMLRNRREKYAARKEERIVRREVEGTIFGPCIKKRGLDVPLLMEYMQLHDVREDHFTSTKDLYEDWQR